MGKIIKDIRRKIADMIMPRSAQPVEEGTPRTGATPLWLYYTPSAPWNVSTVYACIRLISESVANLDLNYMRQDNNGVYYNDRSGALWHLLNVEASPTMGAHDFKARMVADLQIWGNAYIFPQYSSVTMDYSRMVLARPNCVQLGNDGVYHVSDPYEGLKGDFTEDEVIHIKNGAVGADPRTGIGTVAAALRSIDIARVGDTETYNRIVNGGDVRGVVGNDRTVRGVGKYQDQQLQFVAEDLDEKFRAGRRILHLPGSVDFHQFSMSSVDMQFLENRKFAAADICQFFGINPNMISGEGQSAYKSASELANMFMLTALNPLLRRIENEFSRKIIPAEYALWRKIEFDRRGIYGCDPLGQLEYMKRLQEVGLASVNELRKQAGLGLIADTGADTAMVSANLKTLNEINNNGQQTQ